MPPGGAEPRSEELSVLSSLSHELFTAPETGRLLAEAERTETDERHRALLRETRRSFDRATRVPQDLVEALARATSRALGIWTEARQKNEFTRFEPILTEIVELRRRYAAAVDPTVSPYEALYGEYEPYIPLSETRTHLRSLRDGLRPLLDRAANRAGDVPNPFAGAVWPAPQQRAMMNKVLSAVGYNFQHGRLDESAHPFSTGNPYDARITTRYKEDDPETGMSSTLHEFGHALYTQGLPKEELGTPLGEARNLVVHESQSRLWENHVGHSLAFWEFVLPQFREHFPGRLDGTTADQCWRWSNQIQPGFIRVDADEVTYHLHVALRFEVEEALISGNLPVSEVPHAWNERMEKYLGLTPPTDTLGCLQDVHWSHGAFGYFPTYSLGSMLASQVFGAFERDHGPFDGNIRRGDFTPLRTWLKDRIHQHGCLYTTPDLIARATGRSLSADPFLGYAKTKFERVWATA